MKKSEKIIAAIVALVIIGFGIYMTFYDGNVSKYDSKTNAYKVDVNEYYDSDSGTMYKPTFYFRAHGKEYLCDSKLSSSSYPNAENNVVYYDSSNPSKCTPSYGQSRSIVLGIIFIAVGILVITSLFIKKKPKTEENLKALKDKEIVINEKMYQVANSVEVIVSRVIIGFILLVLLILIAIDSVLIKQTIQSKDYIETTATLSHNAGESEDGLWYKYAYTFLDKNNVKHEIIIEIPKESVSQATDTKIIRYNENNPEEYADENMILSKNGFIWFGIKVGAFVILIILFINIRKFSNINFKINNN